MIGGWTGLEEMVAVADSGSFTAAARSLGVSTSHVSRLVAQLERRLATTLFTRSTRRVGLTPEGAILADQLRRILADRDEALASLGRNAPLHGQLRLTCSTGLGELLVAPLVQHYCRQHPEVRVHLELTNRLVDIIAEGFDLGIRTGGVGDARLVARQIGSRRLVVCAAPAYLARAGTPLAIDDLDAHACLIGARDRWTFGDTGMVSYAPRGRWRCNSGAALADATLSGMGLSQIPLFYVQEHIREGRLVVVLEHLQGIAEPVWAVTAPRRQLLPKVSAFVRLLERELADPEQTGI